jgi:hypothetical protein
VKEGSLSFLKKRNKKLLVVKYTRPGQPPRKLIKVFWFFFQKRTAFPSLAFLRRSVALNAGWY